jgi:LuxR family maltose regulon positive regulatory protein
MSKGPQPGVVVDSLKLAPPRPSVRLLHRRRLLDAIEATPDRGVCAITAGPGFGKTQLLGGLVANSEAPVAWLTVESADNDPSRFWTYLSTACFGTGERDQSGGEDVPHQPFSDADSFEAAFANRGAESLWIVIDDAHLLVNADLQDDLRRIAVRLPSGVRMAVASRSELPWVSSKWRAAGMVIDLRERALTLTEDEVGELVTMAGLRVSPAAVGQLRARTEGLPAVVQLAIRSAFGEADPETFVSQLRGDDQSIADFLLQEALDNQPADRRAFLLQTSILDRLTGSLCDAVTGRTDGARMLRELERSHALVNRLEGGDTPWFRYHAMFAELLRAELLTERDETVEQLHLRAGAWYGEHRDPERSFEHLVAGGDLDGAAAIVYANEDEYFRLARAATLHRWYAALPAALEDPDLHVLRLVWASLAERDVVRAGAMLAQLRRLPPHSSPAIALTAELAVVDAHLAARVGDERALLQYAQRALGGFAVEGIGLERPAVDYATLLAARAEVWTGRPDDARRRLESALADTRLADPYWIQTFRGAHAWADAARGDLTAALDRAEQVLAWQDAEGPLPTGCLEALLTRVMALRRRHLPEECARAISDACNAAEVSPLGRPFLVALGVEEAWLEVEQGDLDAAAATIDSLGDLPFFESGRRGRAEVTAAWQEAMRQRDGVTPLTAREREVLALLPTRLEIQEIAERLYVSKNTVKSHVKNIYIKLDVTNRDEAIARAAELRLPLTRTDP